MPESQTPVSYTHLDVYKRQVLSSGDWRIEDTPVDGKAFDFSRLSEIQQKEGFMLFMNESTDCESEGSSTVHSEQDVAHNIGEVLSLIHI